MFLDLNDDRFLCKISFSSQIIAVSNRCLDVVHVRVIFRDDGEDGVTMERRWERHTFKPAAANSTILNDSALNLPLDQPYENIVLYWCWD